MGACVFNIGKLPSRDVTEQLSRTRSDSAPRPRDLILTASGVALNGAVIHPLVARETSTHAEI